MKIRFLYKFVIMHVNGSVLATMYSDDINAQSILSSANCLHVKEVICYNEVKEGLDWEEATRIPIPYDAKKRRTFEG